MNPSRHDRLLGMDARITRRDFLNSTLLAAGSTLVGPMTPRDLLGRGSPVAGDDWTGPGGVGDYARSNGNTFEVMNAAHKIRDHIFDAPPKDAIETGEVFDCVIVGGGISGLAAALFFTRQTAGKLKCLVLENHSIFGGEAKRNEFIVKGQRLLAPQGSDHFQIPYPYSFIARFYDLIGVDISQFKYQTWGGSEPEIPLGRTFEQMPPPEGVYFGARFGQHPGRWIVDPWKNPNAIPIPAAMRAEMLAYRERSSKAGLPFEVPGDEKSRYLDSITLEQHLMEAYGLSRETIRTLMMGEGGGFGAGPDALSGYCAYAFDALHSLDDTPETGWQSFPGGNCGIARQIVKTLIPDSIAGPKTLEAVCRNRVNFAELDREGRAARVRVGATVVHVEHDTEPARSSNVLITYTQDEKTFRLKARSVVMAGGGWTAQLVVRDLPASHRDAYAEFHRMPCMLANVALRNWRFMYKLGLASASWYEGLGSFTSVRKVPVFSTDTKTIGPDSPTVLTFKVLYLSPGLSLQEQGTRGRTELLSTSFRDYERGIREQMTEMFSRSGFDAAADIAGIILNRWGHAYLAPQPGFFFGKDGKPASREVLRRAPFGRIAFANTELSGAMDHKTAVLEAHRAAGQLLDQVLA